MESSAVRFVFRIEPLYFQVPQLYKNFKLISHRVFFNFVIFLRVVEAVGIKKVLEAVGVDKVRKILDELEREKKPRTSSAF